MYCRYCGKEIPDDTKFCPECGKPVDAANGKNREPDYSAARDSGSAGFDGWDGRWDAEHPDYHEDYNDTNPYGDDFRQPGYYSQPQVPANAKSRVAAGVLAILLGALGIHKFYLGYNKQGVITLLITLLTFGIGAVIMEIISIVEGIIYLTKSDWEFYDTYELHRQPWF